MSWLLFMDESGHDHRTLPYEVRGGVALSDANLWRFTRAALALEVECYGAELSEFGTEVKGHKLLDRDRFRWAGQQQVELEPDHRRSLCRSFLSKGSEHKRPSANEFAAYGQASLLMAEGLFELLESHDARLFAAAIPRSVKKPADGSPDDLLRKDHVFLLERFYYFLEAEQKHGLLVMDQAGKTDDARFIHRLRRYFTRTETGRQRSRWIVPVPFFVDSSLALPIQVADLCIYAINWGFRLPSRGMDGPVRPEITEFAGRWLARLQYHGDHARDGHVTNVWGIVYVPDPYEARATKKEATQSEPPESSPSAEPPSKK